MTEIDGFKAPAAKQAGKKPEAATSVGDSDHVTYQLFHRPEQAKFSNNAKVSWSSLWMTQWLDVVPERTCAHILVQKYSVWIFSMN